MNRRFFRTRCIALAYFVQRTKMAVPLGCASTNNLSTVVPCPWFWYCGLRAKRAITLIASPFGVYEELIIKNPISLVVVEIRYQFSPLARRLVSLFWNSMRREIHQKSRNPPVFIIKQVEKTPSSDPVIIRSNMNGTSKSDVLTNAYGSFELGAIFIVNVVD